MTGSDDAGGRTIANAHGALAVVRATSSSVDGQLDEIAQRTSAQAEDVTAVESEISDLSATIEEIAATTSEVSDRSEAAVDRAVEGRASAAEAIDAMADVRAVGGAVAEEVQTLQERIDRIETALAGIDDIADQTNMLALNASIEAARADQDGDGFAVVADEVKSLAEQAQSQADEIDTVLAEVRAATERTVDRMEDAIAEIDRGTEAVEETMDSIEAVTDAIETTAADVESVSEATDEQATTSESLARRVEDVASRSDGIEEDVTAIRRARADQTDMLDEIDDALTAAAADRREQFTGAESIPTGVSGLDEQCAGGVPVGSQSVLWARDGTAVGDIVAAVCASALEAGYAVSLTPPRGVDRGTLADALARVDRAVDTELRADRLFVLDAFGEWRQRHNVFDLRERSLAEANKVADGRRDRPLLVIGNIAGEIAVVGESAARQARYDNDSGVFDAGDTVLNVIDGGHVDDQFARFYAGAADLVLEVESDGNERTAAVTAAPTVPAVDTETGPVRLGPTGGVRPSR